jgi:NAD-dependent deacetylase
MLSHTFFEEHPAEFFDFYRDKMLCPGAQPNAAHKKLAELERAGKLAAVVTQNIDGLHQKAGSKNVFELHGSVLRNHCTRCGKFYPLEFIRGGEGIPRCSCGGVVKPDVVLYEESLDRRTLEGAVRAITDADMLIVGGTSLVVYPAAGLVDFYRGTRLVLINRSPTPLDRRADLVISGKIGETLAKIQVR